MNLNRETLKNMIMEAIDELSNSNEIRTDEDKGMVKAGSLPSQQAAAQDKGKLSGVSLSGAGASQAETPLKKLFAGQNALEYLQRIADNQPAMQQQALQIIAALSKLFNVDMASKGVKVGRMSKKTQIKRG